MPALLIAVVMAVVTGMWQFALFSILSLLSGFLTASIVRKGKKEPDLDFTDQPVWLHPSAIAIGDRKLAKSNLFLREHQSDYIFDYLTKKVAQEKVNQKAKQLAEGFYKALNRGILPFWVGVSDSADLELDLARDGPHALIVGTTGSGKSELLRLITCSLLSSSPMDCIRLILIDFKGGAALREIFRHPTALALITDLDTSNHERFWSYLQGELLIREHQLSTLGVSSIAETNLPRLVVLADELPAILQSGPLPLTVIDAIAARGRSLGVHLIATSQSLFGIPRSLLSNFPMRFGLGITDPGDLISLMPNARQVANSSSKAVLAVGNKISNFDFPQVTALPNLDDPKPSEIEVKKWMVGLETEMLGPNDVAAYLEDPLNHLVTPITWQELTGVSVLVVGASASGKTGICSRASDWFNQVLDCPSQDVLEQALAGGEPALCAVSTSTVLPLSIQRKFEKVIYLRQGNFEQHLSAGLPKTQWQDDLPPGRGWYRGKQIQLVMPEPIAVLSTLKSEPKQQVR